MQKIVYLDNGATTPLCLEAKAAMERVMSDVYGNPSGNYSLGFAAKKILNDSRAEIASALNCYESEIIFTSGGTESDNLAVIGGALANGVRGRHIVTTNIEHHAVLNSCGFLETLGYKVTYVMPGPDGVVSADSVKEAVRPDTVLISVMQANNETGVLQPVEEIGEYARANNILFHTDAVCTFGKIPLDMSRLKADFLSVSAHKIGGPKGTGFLYVRRGAALQPTVYGGGQERGLRSGTENTVGIAGLGAAVRRKRDNMEEFGEKTLRLRDRLQKRILEEIPDAHVNGSLTNRVPGTLNIRFDGIVGTSLLILLDGKGICASAGAACNNAAQKPSHVLTAMGLTDEEAASSIRFSLSELNTEEEVDYVVDALKDSVSYLRKMRTL